MDRMDFLNQFPDQFFDWGIDDPPYFSGPERKAYYGQRVSSKGIKRVEYSTLENTWEVPKEEYFNLLIQKSKNQIIWGVNYYPFLFGPGRIVWDKVNGESSYSDCEIAYCSAHDSVRMFRYMWNGMQQGLSISAGHIMQGNKRLNERRIHQCQKPVMLYKWILKTYCRPGDKIVSCHVGSGSDRIAAFDYGCHFYGAEKNELAFIKQEQRFSQHAAQLCI